MVLVEATRAAFIVSVKVTEIGSNTVLSGGVCAHAVEPQKHSAREPSKAILWKRNELHPRVCNVASTSLSLSGISVRCAR